MPKRLSDLVKLSKKHEGKILLPLVDRHLLERNFVRDSVEEWVHPSAIGKFESLCARQIFLSLFTPLPKYPPHLLVDQHMPRTHRIFDNGTSVHLRWQWYMIKAGLTDPRKGVGWEIPIENPKLGIRGHADAVIWPDAAKREVRMKMLADGHGGEAFPQLDARGFLVDKPESFIPAGLPYLIEVKSMRTDAWKVLFEPLAHHRLQAMCYVAELAHLYPTLNRALFIYENKDNQDVKEFAYTLDRTKWAGVERILMAVQKAKRTQTLPPRLAQCRSVMSERAIECPHANNCFQNRTYTQLMQVPNGPKKKGK